MEHPSARCKPTSVTVSVTGGQIPVSVLGSQGGCANFGDYTAPLCYEDYTQEFLKKREMQN